MAQQGALFVNTKGGMKKPEGVSAALIYIAEIAAAVDGASASHLNNAAAGEGLAKHARWQQPPWFDPRGAKVKVASGSSYQTRLAMTGWSLAPEQEELSPDIRAVFKVRARILFGYIDIMQFYLPPSLSVDDGRVAVTSTDAWDDGFTAQHKRSRTNLSAVGNIEILRVQYVCLGPHLTHIYGTTLEGFALKLLICLVLA